MRKVSRPLSALDVPRAGERRVSLGVPALDLALGGGAVVPSSWLLSGVPGAGKSVLAARLAAAAARALSRRLLFVSAEMEAPGARTVAEIAGCDLSRLDIWPAPELSEVERYCAREKPGGVVVDSIQRLAVDGERTGSEAAIEAVAIACVSMARDSGAVLIAISHATKEGKAAGSLSVAHDVDVVGWLEDRRVLTLSKARGGPGGVVEL